MNISLNNLTTEDAVYDALDMDPQKGDSIDFNQVKENMREYLGVETYKTFFNVVTLPEPGDMESFLTLSNNIKYNVSNDFRLPYIAKNKVTFYNTEACLPLVQENPFMMDKVRELYKQKDHYVVKALKNDAGLKVSEMVNDYEPFMKESFFAFVEHVGDQIQNMSAAETFKNAVSRKQDQQQSQEQSQNRGFAYRR